MITRESLQQAFAREFQRETGDSNANSIAEMIDSFDKQIKVVSMVAGPHSNDIVNAATIIHYWIDVCHLITTDEKYTDLLSPEEKTDIIRSLACLCQALADIPKFLRKELDLAEPVSETEAEFAFIFGCGDDIPQQTIDLYDAGILTLEAFALSCPFYFLGIGDDDI